MTNRKPSTASQDGPALIDAKLKALDDWRGKALTRLRKIILKAGPAVVEEMKWGDVPVWSHEGIICTGESYKQHVKLTFAKGASLPDPTGLFNASLEGNARRAIDIHESEEVDEKALQSLVRAAAELNQSARAARSRKKSGSA